MSNSVNQIDRKSRVAVQSGVIGLVLAVISMLSVSAFVIPMLVRASTTSNLQSSAPLKTEVGRSAFEHTAWRIQEDPTFLAGFAGSPPGSTYQLDIGGETAQITVETGSYAAPPHDLALEVTLTPNVIRRWSNSQVDFTLTVYNNTEGTEEIDRVEVYRRDGVSASYMNGTSSGFEDSDPSSISGGWRWDVWPVYPIEGLGGSGSHTWSLDVDDGTDNYWFDVFVRTVSGSTVQVSLEPSINVSNTIQGSGLSMLSTSSPDIVEADVNETYDVQLLMKNEGSSDEGITRIRHYFPSSLSYVSGSTTGVTTSNPSTSTGYGPRGDMTRLTWSFSGNGADLTANSNEYIRFSLSGSLPIGEHFSQSTYRIDDDNSSSSNFSVTTGMKRVVSSARKFDISVVDGDFSMDTEAWIVENEPLIARVEEK